MSIRVIVACTHLLLAEGITELIKGVTTVQVCVSVNSIEETMRMLAKESFQLMLLDASLPGAQQAVQSIQRTYSQLHLIMLLHQESVKLENTSHKTSLSYLQQNQGREHLVKLIREAIAGKIHKDNSLSAELSHKNFPIEKIPTEHTKPVRRESSFVQLSKRELEILTMITQELASQQIADQLFISVKTVETHRRNIMRKVGVHNYVGLLKYALRQGLV